MPTLIQIVLLHFEKCLEQRDQRRPNKCRGKRVGGSAGGRNRLGGKGADGGRRRRTIPGAGSRMEGASSWKAAAIQVKPRSSLLGPEVG